MPVSIPADLKEKNKKIGGDRSGSSILYKSRFEFSSHWQRFGLCFAGEMFAST